MKVVRLDASEAPVSLADAMAELSREIVHVARGPVRELAAYLDEVLTVDEVAALFKVDAGSVYRWASEGTGPRRVKLGGLDNGPVRFRRGDVLAWLEERAIEPSKAAPRARRARRPGLIVIPARPQAAAEVTR